VVGHPVRRKVDPVFFGILPEIAENVRELEGFSQPVGIGGQKIEFAPEDGDADPADRTGRLVAIALQGGNVRDPDCSEIGLHAGHDIGIEMGRDFPAPGNVDEFLEKGGGFPAVRWLEVVFEAEFPGLEVGAHINVRPGFVGQIVDETAEDIEVLEILLSFWVEKGEGAVEGTFPDFGTGLFKSGSVERQGDLLHHRAAAPKDGR
jgi:hypothetical protein